jgi:hypothetical protein
MDTISLSTDAAKAKFVVVASRVTQGKVDHRQGNIDTVAGQGIIWEACEVDPEVSQFEVSFINLTTGKATWPFVEEADGSTKAQVDYVGPIRLQPPKTPTDPANQVKLTTKVDGGEKVKYVVSAIPTAGIGITPCDPMLIIRPTLISRVTLGLVCAVAGATVGALLALRFG